MVRTEKPKVFGSIVASITVDVIDVEGNPPGSWIAFAPSTDAAGVTIGFQEVATDSVRGAIKVTPRSVDFAGFPLPHVLAIKKVKLASRRAIKRCVAFDFVGASVSPTCSSFHIGILMSQSAIRLAQRKTQHVSCCVFYMEPTVGFEPTTSALRKLHSTN